MIEFLRYRYGKNSGSAYTTSIFDKVKGKNNDKRDNRPYGTNGKESRRASRNPSEWLSRALRTNSPNGASNYETI